MRKVTQEEAQEWTDLAREHGFVDEHGNIALGRFSVERDPLPAEDVEVLDLNFITPLVAGLYTDDLTRKHPPILFDRTADGQIIIPGRWFVSMFDAISSAEDPELNEMMRQKAGHIAHSIDVPDMILPAGTETIEMQVPDEEGTLIVSEALPPGGRISLHLTRRP